MLWQGVQNLRTPPEREVVFVQQDSPNFNRGFFLDIPIRNRLELFGAEKKVLDIYARGDYNTNMVR